MADPHTSERLISRELIDELSQSRNEPEWLTKWREHNWTSFKQLPMPSSRYTSIRGLDLATIHPVIDDEETPEIPDEFQSFTELGEAAGLLIDVDGHVVHTDVPDVLAKQGVVFTDMATAIEEHPDLVKTYIERLGAPNDRLVALQRALFRGGPFVYIPEDVELEQPLRVVRLLTKPGAGLFTQGIAVAEPHSKATYIEELYSPGEPFEQPALEGNTTLVHVGQGAELNYASVQNWNPQVFSVGRRRGIVEQDGHLRWTLGWLGGRTVMNHLESEMNGPGADIRDIQVFFTSGKQHFDLTSNLQHRDAHTNGEVTVKGILRDQSRAVFWGLIKIFPGAQQANAYQSERSMLMDDGPRSNAIPSLEIEADDVRCTHAASASQIDEEQIFYLKSRGLTEDEARRTIVDGFFEPTVAQIPLPLVQERLRGLIERKWRGRI